MRRYKNNLSHYRLFTADPGVLTPCGCVEVIPGDTFNHRTSSLVRFSPLVYPLMHRVQARIHHFFVPMRLLWNGWEDFITQNDDELEVPTVELVYGGGATTEANRLADYFGIPPLSGSGTRTYSALPFRAYNAIYNEWYRDQDLTAPLDVKNATVADFALRKICWQKDYYTAARPWPQKGADVTLPLGESAPLEFTTTNVRSGLAYDSDDNSLLGALIVDSGAPDQITISGGPHATGPINVGGSNPNNWGGIANLQEATAASVNALRRAMALQRFGERMAQFGSRYTDLLASMGVKSSDARLQRPEYLGGGKVPAAFSEVLLTGPDSAGSNQPLGTMGGHGIAPGETRPYTRLFEEHGFVISLFSVRPQAVYSDFVPRFWYHGQVGDGDGSNAYTDFYTPELERIGQQAIIEREISLNSSADFDAWGYNDRYAEYRHHPSQVSGEFRVGESLAGWTWARGFESPPALNQTFVECTPRDDVFAQNSIQDSLYVAVNHRLIARRLVTPHVVGRIL